MNLFRIIFASKAVPDVALLQSLARIRVRGYLHDETLTLTGRQYLDGTHFMHVIEGREGDIQQIFVSFLALHERGTLHLIDYRLIEARDFIDWRVERIETGHPVARLASGYFGTGLRAPATLSQVTETLKRFQSRPLEISDPGRAS